VERRGGVAFSAATPDTFVVEDDHLGELVTDNDHFDFGVKLPSGRIVNRENGRYLDGVAAIVDEFNPELAITARGDLIVRGVAVSQRDRLRELLALHGIDAPEELSPLHRASFACVALPTCGLALAESERYLPEFLDEFHTMLAELSMSEESFEVRMTGCPNGCARPYLGEIGIVGRSKRSYDIFIGADRHGTRLNTLFARDVDRGALVSGLEPLVRRYRDQRRAGESFGDFYFRLDDEEIASVRPASRQRRSRAKSES
ncbi:MAG: assimilatory sulfite reductase (NADPH) hemoprotein subunit, partial [Ferrimicrobium acidiphilum]